MNEANECTCFVCLVVTWLYTVQQQKGIKVNIVPAPRQLFF